MAVVVEVVHATVALGAVLRARETVGLAQVAEVELQLLCQMEALHEIMWTEGTTKNA